MAWVQAGRLHCSNLTYLYEQQDLGKSKTLCLALGFGFPVYKSKVVRRTLVWGPLQTPPSSCLSPSTETQVRWLLVNRAALYGEIVLACT